jgi:hypothetical protein
MATRFFLTACAVVVLASSVFAQDSPTLKPTPSQPGEQTGPPLALEIQYNSTLPPAYLRIEGADVKPHWIWFTRFSTVPGALLPQGPQQIKAVRVMSHWNGETADVRVTLLRGPRMDQEELVTTYRSGVDQLATVNKLEGYGIEPFKIKLILSKADPPPPPNLENRTASIQITQIQPEGIPLPAYRATFRNNSAKNVAALMVYLYRVGAPEQSVLFQGEEGRALIESNRALEEYLPATLPEKTGSSYSPGAAPGYSIAVSSAVFTDGTFEGDVAPACIYERLVFGRKAWLKAVLKIIDEQLAQPDDAIAAQRMKEQLTQLSFVPNPSDRQLKSAVSADCSAPAGIANVVYGLTPSLVRDLDVVVTTRPKPYVPFRSWLASTRERYQQWLSNLEKFPPPRAATPQ